MVIIAKALTALLILIPRAFVHVGHAEEGHSHPPHNMVMLGEREIYASHIVYKHPHNYQVIVQLNLPREVHARYLREREQYPQDQLIYLLDEMDISKIERAERLSGTILRKDRYGKKDVIVPSLRLSRDNFRLLYFNELPLDLRER